jgi:succinoglycan biosynthesis transport protein ExoP
MPRGDTKRANAEPDDPSADADHADPDPADDDLAHDEAPMTPMGPPSRPDRETGRHATDGAAWPATTTHPAHRGDPQPSRRGAGTVSSGEIFGMLRRRAVTLLVCFVISLAVAFGAFSSAAKEYDAVSAVKVAPVTAVGDTGATKDISTITESRIVTSTAVAARAAVALRFRGSLDTLLANVTVSSPLNSQLIYITYAAGGPKAAARGANAFAQAYLDYRKSVGEATIADQIRTLTKQVGTLQSQLKALPATAAQRERTALQTEIDRFNGQIYTQSTTVVVPGQVVGVAQAPTAPSSPKKLLYLAGGILGGLIIGVAMAVVRDRRDDSVHGPVDLEDSVGAPALATIPTRRRRTEVPVVPASTSTVSTGSEVDAYRTVATKLRTPVTGHGSNSFLLVRGGRAREEHAPVNLAAMFARQGVQTALVTTERGLDHVNGFFGDEKVPTSIDEGLAPVPSVPNLWVLSLGPEDEMDSTVSIQRTMIADILNLVDVALLDAVNVELPSSVLALAQLTEAAVVVAVDGRTTHAEIARSIRELGQVGAVPLGGVLYARNRRRLRWTRRRRPSG